MTQKYEPVEWTDETPTQPGTLINKARLDQMQSAHHFADGFEEVDAIPTEDPGTEYHKVVYCTADSTFYRWDGNEWTADIDDDTKRLLEEHEADHANPHAVTKAQVGLGNADNTADLDKPISTATAAALATKADKATTLAGYGIGDAYTKAQVDGKLTDGSVTKLGTADVGSDTLPIKLVGGSPTPVADALAKDSTVVHLTGDTLTGALFSESAGANSYNGARLSADKYSTKATGFDVTSTASYGKAHPLAGITDDNGVPAVRTIAYLTGTEMRYGVQFLDTAKASHVQELLTFDRAAGTIASPLVQASLDAYSTMVRTANAQTIGGIKTFTDSPVIKNPNIASSSAVPGSNTQTRIVFNANDGSRLMTLEDWCYTGGSTAVNLSNGATRNSLTPSPTISLGVTATGAGYIQALNQRAYNTANVSDLVTIGTLKASTDVVHTSGPETIQGIKTFYSTGFTSVRIGSTRIGDNNLGGYEFFDGNNKRTGTIIGMGNGIMNLYPNPDGAVSTNAVIITGQRAYNASNTSDVATIATLDAYTPMVRTTGNQEISGRKMYRTGTEGKRYLSSVNSNTSADNLWAKGFSLTMATNRVLIVDVVTAFNNSDVQDARVKIVRTGATSVSCTVINSAGTVEAMAKASNYVATLDGDTVTFYTYKRRRYNDLKADIWFYSSYGGMVDLPEITWINELSADPSTETHTAIAVGTMVAYHNVA